MSRLRRRQIVALQAFIDDSLASDEVLVLAGYIADFERWAQFSIDWDELLGMCPKWDRFKMVEVASSRDELRWERAGWFYRAIERHAQAFVACAVEIEGLRRIVREFSLDDIFSNPYQFALYAITDATMQFQHELGIIEPIDFIFDERGEKGELRKGWAYYTKSVNEEFAKRLGREPRFEDDMEFLPLQAADLLAWHIRKHWLQHRSITTADCKVSWPEKRVIPGYKFNFGYKEIRAHIEPRWAKHYGMTRVEMTVNFFFNGKKI
jgi:hypothetical protein